MRSDGYDTNDKTKDDTWIAGVVVRCLLPSGSDGNAGVILSRHNIRTAHPERKIAVGSATNVLKEDDT